MKKKTGRPPGAVHTHQLQTRVSADFLVKIDEWRRFQPDLPSRTEAIRRIVERFLSAEAVPSFRSMVEPERPKPRPKRSPK